MRAAGGVVKKVQARAENAFQLAKNDLAAAAPGAKALLVNTPHNPTGAVYSQETLEGVAAVCKAEDLWLISDEVYDSQVWNGRHISA